MTNYFWLYSLLPAFSALSCVFLLLKLYKNHAQWFSLRLFFNLLLMNVFQMAAYAVISTSFVFAGYMADMYLMSAYFFFAHLLMFALQLSRYAPSIRTTNLVYIFPVILSVAHMSGFVVESYEIKNGALLHNDGELSLFQDVYILLTNVLVLFVFWKNVLKHKSDRVLLSRNLVALLSFVPLVFAFFIIVILSMTKYAVPVVVIGPLVTLYAAFVFYYVSRTSVMDLSIGFRFFIGRLKLAYLVLETHKTKEDVKMLSQKLDRQFIREALKENNFHIQNTADYLGINHTTLRNKIKQYDLAR